MQEIEQIKSALAETYIRLKAAQGLIDKANSADDLDALEHASGLQQNLIDRVEFLKAKLQTELRYIDAEAQKIASGVGFDVLKHYLVPSHEKLI